MVGVDGAEQPQRAAAGAVSTTAAGVAKAMLSCGFSGLYLNRQMAPSSHAVAPTGGQADLHRLSLEIRAMERLLVRYRS